MKNLTLNCNHVLNSLPNVTIYHIYDMIINSDKNKTIKNRYENVTDDVEYVFLRHSVNDSSLDEIQVKIKDCDSTYKTGYEIRPYFSYKQCDEHSTLISEQLQFRGFYYYDNTKEIKLDISDIKYIKGFDKQNHTQVIYDLIVHSTTGANHKMRWLFNDLEGRIIRNLIGSIERIELNEGISLFIKLYRKLRFIKGEIKIKPIISQDCSNLTLKLERFDIEIKG